MIPYIEFTRGYTILEHDHIALIAPGLPTATESLCFDRLRRGGGDAA